MGASFRIWVEALFRPSVNRYRQRAGEPKASARQACIWMAVSGAAAYFIATTLGIFSQLVLGQPVDISFTALLDLVTVSAAVPMGLLLTAGIQHGFARLLGGRGRFGQLAFTLSSFSAPSALILAPLFPIIRGTVIAYIAYPYLGVLHVLAIMAIYRFSLGKALLVAVLALMGLTAALAGLAFAYFLLAGPPAV